MMDAHTGAVANVDPTHDLAEVFWAGCERGELWLQRCTSCDRWQFYPRAICSHCWAPASMLEWRQARGGAVLESFSVVHRGSGAFAAEAPYVVALVRLDEGPMMMTNVVGSFDDLVIGARLALEFAVRAGRRLPVFRAVASTS